MNRTITEEIRTFLEVTGLPQMRLAEVSSVSASSISRLLSGKRNTIMGDAQDRIREAIKRLTLEESRKTKRRLTTS